MLAENGVELELASLRQSLALIRFRLRSSAQPDGWRKDNEYQPRNSNPESLKRAALEGRESQQTVMFARERSARGQMKSPLSPSGAREGLGVGVGSQVLLFP